MNPLEKLMKTPDSKIPEDDHPDRPAVLTPEEQELAVAEMKVKYAGKDFPETGVDMGKATVESLNKQ